MASSQCARWLVAASPEKKHHSQLWTSNKKALWQKRRVFLAFSSMKIVCSICSRHAFISIQPWAQQSLRVKLSTFHVEKSHKRIHSAPQRKKIHIKNNNNRYDMALHDLTHTMPWIREQAAAYNAASHSMCGCCSLWVFVPKKVEMLAFSRDLAEKKSTAWVLGNFCCCRSVDKVSFASISLASTRSLSLGLSHPCSFSPGEYNSLRLSPAECHSVY